ncbi:MULTISPECIES: alpha/beta fold hydrolase [Gordonia]|uniref:alpha/beta fold hydrolase n=1 Tax=Gordonia TaxID=2053 RepID=UPI0013316634|nr:MULTISPECIES: alpha/beta hydrolase [Gordonia]KAF0968007.1 2-succinyl-6-hydroxy-2,4-cyclohexadiene-1-carboxylate synthase [Gordonia sp. YY1]UPW12039.1 alpha/beta hydrolase [Gordonia amicalis]
MIEARYLEIQGALAFVEIVTADPTAPGRRVVDIPTVLCIHTAGQSGVQWRCAAQDIADRGYRVIVPDLPGHGRSEPCPTGPITGLGDYADWLTAVLRRLDVERPYVIGCSIGGKLTLELATRPEYPLAGAVAMAAETGPGRVRIAGLRRELEDVAGPARADRTYLGSLASVGRAVPAARAHLIGLMHKREDPEISSSDLIGWGSHDVRDRLTELTCGLHLVCGADDPWISVDAVRRAADEINELDGPRAEFTELAGYGHYPMEELPDFGSRADAWLRSLSSGTRTPEVVS